MSPDSSGILDADELRLLAGIGLMAAHGGDRQRSAVIFNGLRALRPESALPWIGLALSQMGAGNPAQAVALLQQARRQTPPPCEELDVFLGIALLLAQRRADAHRVLRDMLSRPCNPSPQRMLAAKLLAANDAGDEASMMTMAANANQAIRWQMADGRWQMAG